MNLSSTLTFGSSWTSIDHGSIVLHNDPGFKAFNWLCHSIFRGSILWLLPSFFNRLNICFTTGKKHGDSFCINMFFLALLYLDLTYMCVYSYSFYSFICISLPIFLTHKNLSSHYYCLFISINHCKAYEIKILFSNEKFDFNVQIFPSSETPRRINIYSFFFLSSNVRYFFFTYHVSFFAYRLECSEE